MTKEQDDAITWLALKGDRIAVDTPYADGSVEVSLQFDATFLVTEEGNVIKRPINNTINWSE